MIDSHTHLGSCAEDPAELVERARAAGVTRMLTVGTDEASNRGAIAAAETFDDVFAAVGRHPNNSLGFDAEALDDLRCLAAHPRVRAIGETGLDFFRDGASREAQLHAFSAQIALAREVDKPLVIHCREAADETIDVLRREATGVTVLLHCFSMPDRLEECAQQGWWISFAGNCTYPKARELARAVELAPAERLLVETDAPYLTPQAVRKHRNEPAFVTHTAAWVAARRGLDVEALDLLVTANAARLFGW